MRCLLNMHQELFYVEIRVEHKMYEEFILSTKKLKDLCYRELSKRESGVLGESSVYQLEQIIKELDEISFKISIGSIPSQSNRYLTSFAYAFKEWGWDMQNPTDLYALLCRVNTSYKNLK